jgi:uncharacterized protein
MSREYPDWISPGRAAEGKRLYGGTIPFSRMKRLAPLLADASGEAEFTAAFRLDIERRIVIDISVKAALPLVCQASLETYDEVIDRSSKLAVIDHEYEINDVPEHYDPVQTENGRLALLFLVEEELLLSLPQIPRKPGLENVSFSTGGDDGEDMIAASESGVKKNPFAALQGKFKQDKQD